MFELIYQILVHKLFFPVLAGSGAGLSVAYISNHFKNKPKKNNLLSDKRFSLKEILSIREKLTIIENGIDFFAKENKNKTKDSGDNDPPSLIVTLDVDCRGRSVQAKKARLELRSNKTKRAVMMGDLYKNKSTIKLERGEATSIKFVFNPSGYVKTLNKLKHLFNGAIYSLEIFNSRNKKVGQTINSRRIKEIRTVKPIKYFHVAIPPMTNKDDAIRAIEILKGSDFGGVELLEKEVEPEFHNVLPFNYDTQ